MEPSFSDSPLGNRLSSRLAMPSYSDIVAYYSGLLAARSMPSEVRWIFREDWARVRARDGARHYAFCPRGAEEAASIAAQAFRRLRFHRPLAVVAYGINGDFVLTGLQADIFDCDDDVYVKDWDIFFDARNNMDTESLIVEAAVQWENIKEEQPIWLSELDFAVSVDWIRETN